MYEIHYRRDYHTCRDYTSFRGRRFATLDVAREARVVSGDLVVYAHTLIVVDSDDWLWEWEKSDPTCYAQKARKTGLTPPPRWTGSEHFSRHRRCVMNQCDGCMRGLPLRASGIPGVPPYHVDVDGMYGTFGCTAHLYGGEPPLHAHFAACTHPVTVMRDGKEHCPTCDVTFPPPTTIARYGCGHSFPDDGRMPRACPTCNPAAAPSDATMQGPTHWGPRFDAEYKCLRHKAEACPSCLAYALGDANAALSRERLAREQEREYRTIAERVSEEAQSTMEALRERASAAEQSAERMAGALRGLPCMFVWRARREGKLRAACSEYTSEEGDLPEHAWCPVCRARGNLTHT